MVYSEPLQLESLPSWIGQSLGFSANDPIGLIMGRLLEIFIVLAFLFIPAMYLKIHVYILEVGSILALAFLTAMGVMDFWIWPIIGLYVAYELSHKVGGMHF